MMNRPLDATDLATDLADAPPTGPVPPEPGPRGPLDLRTLLGILWQRKWVVIMCLGLTLGATHIVLGKIPPRYTASAEVMLNNRQTTVVDIERVVSDLGGHDVSANEQRVLNSRRLIRGVIGSLRLDRDPEFNPALRPPSAAARWQADLRAMLAGRAPALFPAPGPELADPALRAEHDRLAVIGNFRDALDVRGIPFTRAIAIAVTSTDPAKAALIANTLADLYIVDQLETKFEATRRASAWLDQRIGDLKRKVETSEAAVEAFKAGQNVGTGQGRDLTTQQIGELNTELITARAARAGAEARFEQIRRRIDEGGIGAAARVLSSELILTLRTQLAALVRREAELGTRYGDRHPKIINIRAEIADARGAIGAEVRKIIAGMRNDVAVARAREGALEEGLTDLEARSVAFSQGSVELRQLEREATADRLIYENFLKRFRETTEQEGLQAADARLLSAAEPPLEPSRPNARKVLLVAGALGLALGLGLVVLLEALANTFRAASELAGQTGIAVLATLPRHGRRRSRRRVLDFVRNRPNSALAEAARGLRTTLLLSGAGRPPRVVMVTSSVPGEGKSTTCLLLAHMSNRVNRRAIVVDCDIRRPTLHQSFDPTGTGGLVPVLDGTAMLDAAIVTDAGTGLDLLPTVQAVPQAADVLSSSRFLGLIGELRARYDLVLLDTPPILAVSDAGAIGGLADAAIYAVRWGHTPRGAVAEGLGRLGDLGVPVAGCVLTLADRRHDARHAYARYGDGYAYYAGAERYYAD